MSDIYSKPTINNELPIIVDSDTNKAEIDLMLRQLFLLKQDTEIIQKLIMSGSVNANVTGKIEPLDKSIELPQRSMEIVEESFKLIRDDAIGEISIKDLEKEAITRTLSFFNNNRRKTARSLGMSERTLYRKIEEFGLEPKINKKK